MLSASTSASSNTASVMLSNNGTTNRAPEPSPLALYSRSLHDYTLRLWTESRRVAEEKTRQKAARKQQIMEEDGHGRAAASLYLSGERKFQAKA